MAIGFLLGLLAAFFWSITNLVDKYLVTKYSSDGNIGGVLLLSCFFPIFLALLALFFSTSLFSIAFSEMALLVIAGLFMVAWIYFYLKALAEDDASVVMTMLVLAPVFSFIFASIILEEWPSAIQLTAGLIIMLGALTVSYEPQSGKLKWRLIFYAVSASAITGFMYTLFKFATVTDSFWESMFWRSLGMIATGLILYITIGAYRRNFHSFLKEHYGKGVSLNASNETFTLMGDTLFAFAILFAPLALIQTTEGYQPIFILIMVFVLSKLGVLAIQEHNTNGRIVLKICGVLLTLAGGGLLAFAG